VLKISSSCLNVAHELAVRAADDATSFFLGLGLEDWLAIDNPVAEVETHSNGRSGGGANNTGSSGGVGDGGCGGVTVGTLGLALFAVKPSANTLQLEAMYKCMIMGQMVGDAWRGVPGCNEAAMCGCVDLGSFLGQTRVGCAL
jgi:hypothetical protein